MTDNKKGVTNMSDITISMAAGRTDEQKAGMMRDITQALVKNLGVDADAVVIQINEAPLAHKMKGRKEVARVLTAGRPRLVRNCARERGPKTPALIVLEGVGLPAPLRLHAVWV